MYAEYEEKTFENYFNGELDQRTSVYFPLGQVQEGTIGVDSAAHSKSWRLWSTLGYPFLFSPHFTGTNLQEIALEMEKHLGNHINNIPEMRVNLLFQYKRPEFITKSLGAEWYLWHQSYFRYNLNSKQHGLLAHIESMFGNNVLVLYAAPAVRGITELVDLKVNNSIITNTNFRKASELTGHQRNTYVKAGTYSQACSDPERIENFDLIELIENIEPTKRLDNLSFLIRFAEEINRSIKESEYRNAAFEKRLSDFQELEKFELLFALLSMSVFREITGIQWLVSVGQ